MSHRLHLLLGLAGGLLSARDLVPTAPVPLGLSASDWAQIRALHEKHRHSAVRVGSEHRARNPRQQWLTRFDGRGFTIQPDEAPWKWGLELRGYGSRPKVAARDERVVYEWTRQVEEWYINGERGLEHGFTIRSRPAGAPGPLRLDFHTRGGLPPKAMPGGRGVTFGDVLRYDGLTAWDAAGRLLPAHIEAAGATMRIEVDDRGAQYPVTIDPIAQQAYIKASNTGIDDRFGRSVAVSGDTVVVGAYLEASNATGVNGDQTDNTALQSGAAYIFVRTNGVWSQQAYLKASNTGGGNRFGAVGDYFGYSVAISGDTVVVGAYFEDSSATGVNGDQANNNAQDSGAAYVFTRAAGVWSQQAYLKASNTRGGSLFGLAVAISGDTVVAGSVLESSNATGVNGDQSNTSVPGAGAAYVFTRSAGVWTQQAYLKAATTAEGDNFGQSVSVSGDTIIAGAPQPATMSGPARNGAAYVFARSGNVWSPQATLTASNANAGDGFGRDVAGSGETIAVGAEGEDSNATGVNGNQADNSAPESGAVYVFARSGTAWSQQAYLKASINATNDNFGHSVALSGRTVAVGTLRGTAYLFSASNGTWSQLAALTAFGGPAGALFGESVALSGDVAGIGNQSDASSATGINGSPNNIGAPNSGAAFAFELDRQVSNAGVYRNGFFWVQDVNGDRAFAAPPDRAFAFGGVAGDIPISGDWNGDGTEKAGIYRASNGLFILDFDGDRLFNPAIDKVYDLGVGTAAGDVPVVGDWNGSGASKVGLFRAGFLWILDSNGNGVFQQGADQAIPFGGVAGDVPVVGDWDGNGTANLGLFRSGFFWILDVNGNGQLDNVNQPNGDRAFALGGLANDVPVVGKWTTGDNRSKAGLFRGGFLWILDANGNSAFDGTGAGQDIVFAFGGIAGDKPVVGRW